MLERSTRIYSEAGSDAVEVAETRFDLARALWHTPATHARATSLAHAARRTYEAAGRDIEVDAIDAWLEEHTKLERAAATP